MQSVTDEFYCGCDCCNISWEWAWKRSHFYEVLSITNSSGCKIFIQASKVCVSNGCRIVVVRETYLNNLHQILWCIKCSCIFANICNEKILDIQSLLVLSVSCRELAVFFFIKWYDKWVHLELLLTPWNRLFLTSYKTFHSIVSQYILSLYVICIFSTHQL